MNPRVRRNRQPNVSNDPLEADVLLKAEGLEKTFKQAGHPLTIFNNLSIKLEAGEIVALVGQSGSGKSTLLQILGLLDQPTSGSIRIGAHDTAKLSEHARTQLRRDTIGFVYQFHHLLPELSALENVALPLIIAGRTKAEARDKAEGILKNLGLAQRLTHRPAKLSGGERQRVAIGRALANDPMILLADEPTGNLDPETSAGVFELLLEQVRNRGIAALIATHNMTLADEMDKAYELKSGRLTNF